MTFQEFTQKVTEYDKMRTSLQISEKDYKLIEHVYTFHPSISETEGKRQVAMLYCEFGMRIFRDMEATADRNQYLENDIRLTRVQLHKLLDEADELRKGAEA